MNQATIRALSQVGELVKEEKLCEEKWKSWWKMQVLHRINF